MLEEASAFAATGDHQSWRSLRLGLMTSKVIDSTGASAGFFFSSSGIGLIGRFSGLPVVNVSRGGGLVPALWVH